MNASGDSIRRQLNAAYAPYADDLDSHARMLDGIRRIEDVAVASRQDGRGQWTVSICMADWLGGLSMVSGLFAALRLDISSVDVFTLVSDVSEDTGADPPATRAGRRSRTGRGGARRRPPGQPAGLTRKILSIYRVSSPEDVQPDLWIRFEDDLSALAGQAAAGNIETAQGNVVDRFTHAMRQADETQGQLLPIRVHLDQESSTDSTVLSIQSQDTPGFLFAFSTALASLKVNVRRAEVRTLGGEVHDTFWLTDPSGRKITSERTLRDLRVAAVLIKHFTHLLPRSSNPQLALRQFHALVSQVLSSADRTGDIDALESPEVLETLADLMGVSKFLWEDFLRMQHESLFPVLVDTSALDEVQEKDELHRSIVQQVVSGIPPIPPIPQETRVRRLNRFKDREMFRIDLRHITGRVDFEQFAGELTTLAEVVVAVAVELAEGPLSDRFGRPMLTDDVPCRWCVCALGKFGGRELGFGSDVELVFIYEAEGESDGHERVPNSLYFGELVKEFLRTLEGRREGIFEVDLRLRPYGSKGALAFSLKAFQTYYSPEGDARQFERLALVKMRPVAGDPALAAKTIAARDLYVYSAHPLDIENLRHLRKRQASELVQPGSVNVKHGVGGLVDLEYYVQACQVSAGGTDPSLRLNNTVEAIDMLADRGILGSERAADIRASYAFLRRLIDALRVVRGHAKDLSLPDQGSREFLYLAQRLDFESPAALATAISDHMGFAGSIWE